MKILYIHQYFCTPKEPGGTRSYWIAQALVKKGYGVTMITTSSAVQRREEKSIDGINVIYLKEEYHQNMTILRRLKAFFGFAWKSLKEANRQDADLIIATSTPLTVGIPALFMKFFWKVPYIFEVRDLWPEVPIQMGALRNPILIKIARYFEQIIYKNAKHVIALSPGMLDGILKYIPRERTSMIPNMAKKDEFWPREKDTALIEQLELSQETLKVIHFGALGIANGASTIIESANLMKADKTVEFIFVGGGATEKTLKKLCKEYGLENVKFIGRFSMLLMSEIVNFCDVSLVSFKNLPILYTNSPNKLFDSLSAGKPIIVNSAGWTKELVEQHHCGYYYDPNNPKQLVEKIKYLQANPEEVKILGKNARRLAENKYDKSILCNQFVHVVENIQKSI